MADGLCKQGQLQSPCGQAAVQTLLHRVTRNISNAPGEHQSQVAQPPSPLFSVKPLPAALLDIGSGCSELLELLIRFLTPSGAISASLYMLI